MSAQERLSALKLLSRLFKEQKPLSLLLGQDSYPAMTKEICFGLCRHYVYLQALLGLLVKKKPKQLEVELILLIGLYQLCFMRQPDYAVVKETVTLVQKSQSQWAKGLVNAVLREFCRQKDFYLEKINQDPSALANHPLWLLDRIKKAWPSDWEAIVQANNQHPPLTLRVNRRKQSRDQYLEGLRQQGLETAPHPFAKEALILSSPCEVKLLPGFAEGAVSVQDAAAQLAVEFLDLQPGLTLVDACAAPGGKTCHILEREPNLHHCLAVEIEPHRLEKIQDNLDRLNLKASLIQADASRPDQWTKGEIFDRILLDAPCSATGVIRRNPDIKMLRKPEEIEAVCQTQKQLLNALWPILKPGGRLLYATCSIMPEENEAQIADFVKAHPDCRVDVKPMPFGRFTGHGWQILPGEANMDGFFYAPLVKIL